MVGGQQCLKLHRKWKLQLFKPPQQGGNALIFTFILHILYYNYCLPLSHPPPPPLSLSPLPLPEWKSGILSKIINSSTMAGHSGHGLLQVTAAFLWSFSSYFLNYTTIVLVICSKSLSLKSTNIVGIYILPGLASWDLSCSPSQFLSWL